MAALLVSQSLDTGPRQHRTSGCANCQTGARESRGDAVLEITHEGSEMQPPSNLCHGPARACPQRPLAPQQRSLLGAWPSSVAREPIPTGQSQCLQAVAEGDAALPGLESWPAPWVCDRSSTD